MLFWTASLALTLVACLAILRPFLRSGEISGQPHGADMAVYRDQLAELDRDRARGLIGEAEAEQARAEIGRRILALSPGSGSAAAGAAATTTRFAALLAIAAVPLVAWGTYAVIGSPGLPGQPLAARLNADPSTSTVDELVARAERHLAEKPADARGWEVLAPVYLRQGRADDAVRAWQSAIRIAGSNALRETGLGEALTAAAGGVVTADARAAFERAQRAEPGAPKAGYFLALALGQEGRFDEALARWRAMKAGLPADSPWHGPIDDAIAGTEQRMARAGAEDAAQDMADADRSAMIEEMVAGLDQRLRDDPSDAEGWRRLIRSYMVMGRPDEARDALKRAQDGLSGDPEAARAVAEFARTQGVAAVE